MAPIHPDSAVDLDAKRARQYRIVADLRMDVQRDVRAVERHVCIEKAPEATIPPAGDRLIAIPEQPMVHYQEIGPSIRGCLDRRQRRVHCRGDASDRTGIADLQTVQRRRMIRNFGYPEEAIEVQANRFELHALTIPK
jgi:hypothetical protein